MKQHSASDLRYWAALLAPDGATVITPQVGAGIEDLSGVRLMQAQLESSETTHMIVLRYLDAQPLPPQGHVQLTDPGNGAVTLYVVDYLKDPRKPRARVWAEVYCHVERANS